MAKTRKTAEQKKLEFARKEAQTQKEVKTAQRKADANRINTKTSRRSIQAASKVSDLPAVIRIERTESGLFRCYLDDGTDMTMSRLEFYSWQPPAEPYRFLLGGFKQAREGRSKKDIAAFDRAEHKRLLAEQREEDRIRAEEDRVRTEEAEFKRKLREADVPSPSHTAAPAASEGEATMAIVKKSAADRKAAASAKKAAADPKAAKAAKAKAAKAKAAKAAEPIETDEFGTRLGTQAHTINKAFAKGGDTEAIAKRAGLPQPRVRLHIRWALERGFVKEDKEGNVKLTGKKA